MPRPPRKSAQAAKEGFKKLRELQVRGHYQVYPPISGPTSPGPGQQPQHAPTPLLSHFLQRDVVVASEDEVEVLQAAPVKRSRGRAKRDRDSGASDVVVTAVTRRPKQEGGAAPVPGPAPKQEGGAGRGPVPAQTAAAPAVVESSPDANDPRVQSDTQKLTEHLVAHRAGRKPRARSEQRVSRTGTTVRTRNAMPAGMLERVRRAKPNSAHKMFLLDREVKRGADDAAGPCEEYAVLGATGNVYAVEVSRWPRCSCPDFAKRQDVCKHLLFVYMRVLRLSENDKAILQKALLTDEVVGMLSGGRGEYVFAGDNPVADGAVIAKFREATGAGAGAAPGEARREGECSVCFDDLDSTRESWCAVCKHPFHTACLQKWMGASKKGSCPLCRADFKDGAGKLGGAAGGPGGQPLNLASVSAAHRGGTSVEELYGETSKWIRYHQARGGLR